MTDATLQALRFLGPPVAGCSHDSGDTQNAFALFSRVESWDAALGFATSINARLPFVWRVRQRKWFEDLPEPIREECEAILRRERMVLTVLDEELCIAAEALRAAEVPVIVLKGMDVGHRIYRVYSSPMFRPVGDVDLLVPKSRYQDARRALGQRGYRQTEPHFRHSFRSALARGPQSPAIDLHFGLIQGDRDVAPLWDRSRAAPDSLPSGLRVLGPEDCLVYLLRHCALLHVLESPVWLMDLHWLLHAGHVEGNLNWELLLSELRRTQATAAAAFVFGILRNAWGTPVPEDVFQTLRRGQSALRRVMIARLNSLPDWFDPKERGLLWVIRRRFLLREGVGQAFRDGFLRCQRKAVERCFPTS